jgi:hypothetical protein
MTGPILIVTGAHLQAELHDRPIAYALRQALLDRLDAPAEDSVLVCSDLWYLNQPELRARPTVSIGPPDVNALTASLADRLPSVFVVDGVMIVQQLLDADTPIACCWGSEPVHTAAAMEVFVERFAAEFLDVAQG